MADTEATGPVRLGESDIDDAMALSAEAGWNQTAADWRMMMTLGNCLGFRDPAGSLVASGLALPMGKAYGWISMVLVTKSWRRRGLATRLVEAAIDHLTGRGITPLLDATPDGAKVYSRMGFEPLYGMTRWQRSGKDRADIAASSDGFGSAFAEWVIDYDRAVFGADREHILRNLSGRGPVISDPERRGFLLGRAGRLATQIGPVSAENEATARRLVDTALAQEDRSVFVDVFDAHPGLNRHFEQLGFTVQRPFTRMMYGGAVSFGDPGRAFAAAGPELG